MGMACGQRLRDSGGSRDRHDGRWRRCASARRCARVVIAPPPNVGPLRGPSPQGEGGYIHTHVQSSPSPCGLRPRSGPRLGGGVCLALILAALVLIAPRQAAADENGLWRIVSERCVPNEKLNHQPSPCVAVDLAGGYVVLKDLVGRTQYLLLPTARVTGMES